MSILKDTIIELNLTEEQLKDKEIRDFVMQVAFRKSSNNWVQYWNGNGFIELNKNDGTLITTVITDEEFKPEFPLNMDMEISNMCTNGCSFCLTQDAKFIIGDKLIPINEIKIGDKVNSYNIKNNINEIKNVTHLFKRYYKGDLIVITSENGDVLKLTPNHKIYTQRGYVRADELNINDKLIKETNGI